MGLERMIRIPAIESQLASEWRYASPVSNCEFDSRRDCESIDTIPLSNTGMIVTDVQTCVRTIVIVVIVVLVFFFCGGI